MEEDTCVVSLLLAISYSMMHDLLSKWFIEISIESFGVPQLVANNRKFRLGDGNWCETPGAQRG